MTRRREKGFTIVELLAVMIVIGILATMGVMRYIDLRHRALSAKAASELDMVRKAGYSQFYDTGVWPPGAGPGVVPPQLQQYLPQGNSFVRPDYTLEWENFVPPGGGVSASYQIAVRLSSSNTRLMQTIAQTLGSRAPYVMMGNDLVVIVVGPDGRI